MSEPQDCEWCEAKDVPVLYYETLDPPDAETGQDVVFICQTCFDALATEATETT